jgi:hypothetical protein
MKNLLLVSTMLIFFVTTVYVPVSEGQNNLSLVLRPPPIDIKQIILTVSPLIEVEYQGESIVVLKADEDTLLLTNSSMSPFWKAIDAVKHYGYSVNDIATSGMGSQGNPTRFYAIMSKP